MQTYPRNNHIEELKAAMSDTIVQPVLHTPTQRSANLKDDTDSALTEISRRWLAEINPEHFNECRAYLTAVRLARHMSKIEVCRASQSDGTAASGVSLPTISKIERGAYGEPGFRTMIKVARGYGVPLSNLQRYFD